MSPEKETPKHTHCVDASMVAAKTRRARAKTRTRRDRAARAPDMMRWGVEGTFIWVRVKGWQEGEEGLVCSWSSRLQFFLFGPAHLSCKGYGGVGTGNTRTDARKPPQNKL